jgi:hypothetical protein
VALSITLHTKTLFILTDTLKAAGYYQLILDGCCGVAINVPGGARHKIESPEGRHAKRFIPPKEATPCNKRLLLFLYATDPSKLTFMSDVHVNVLLTYVKANIFYS